MRLLQRIYPLIRIVNWRDPEIGPHFIIEGGTNLPIAEQQYRF